MNTGRRVSWLLAAAIVLLQLGVYGRALTGQAAILPLDILAQRQFLPAQAPDASFVPHDLIGFDLVAQTAPVYTFEARELAAGRWPAWNPLNFCGVPNVLFSPFCPFYWIMLACPGWRAFSLVHLAKALVAGLGAHRLLGGVFGASPRAAALFGLTYPLTGYFVYWQGFHPTDCTAWLPWLLLATVRTADAPSARSVAALALTSAAGLVGSKLDVGLQMLMVSGLTALWRLATPTPEPRAARIARLAAAWALGMALAAPYTMPLLAYMATGDRLAARVEGVVDRPPLGQLAVPEVVLPGILGSTRAGSARLVDTNLPESSSTASAGLTVALVLAPLAFARPDAPGRGFALALALLGVAWAWNLPGVAWLLSVLPGVRLLSHNRLTFATGLGLVVLGSQGLDALDVPPPRRGWFALPLALCASVCVVCFSVALRPPPTFPPGCGGLNHPGPLCPLERELLAGALFGLSGATAWAAIALGRARLARVALPALLVLELAWHAAGTRAPCDPALYYPRTPLLERLAARPPGRVLPIGCLWSNVNMMYGLPELRGYDGIDAHRYVELLARAAAPGTKSVPHARTAYFTPRLAIAPDGTAVLPPILDLLGTRYVVGIAPLPPAARPLDTHGEQWVLENTNALPRAFVPRRTLALADDAAVLARMADDAFDPRDTALTVEGTSSGPCAGRARITGDLPSEVVVEAELSAPGLVVLADRHEPGWTARDATGATLAVERVDHVLRGVRLPAGRHVITFRYAPTPLALGAAIAVLAATALAAWCWRLARAS